MAEEPKRKKRKHPRTAEMQTLPPEKRNTFNAERIVKQKLAHGEKHKMCKMCWLDPNNCFCYLVKEKIPFNHRVVVYMHYKEYRRCSNTAKLIPVCLDDAEILLSGTEEGEARMKEELATAGDKAIVLFPSTDSCTFAEYHNRLGGEVKESAGEESDEHPGEKRKRSAGLAEGYTVFVVDGTWRNAKNLNKCIDSAVQRISISPAGGSLFAPLRTQTQEDRICTVEALVYLMSDMGLIDVDRDRFLEYLKIAVDACLLQTCCAPAYWTAITEGKSLGYANPKAGKIMKFGDRRTPEKDIPFRVMPEELKGLPGKLRRRIKDNWVCPKCGSKRNFKNTARCNECDAPKPADPENAFER